MRFSIFLFLISAGAIGALRFECKGGVHFDSVIPLLEEGVQAKVVLLTSNEVCGQKADFASDCNANLIQQGDEYNFSWRCDEVFGDLYFTSENGGYAEFRCSGEKLAAMYQHRVYRNCSLKR
jgi:hypothetical protein